MLFNPKWDDVSDLSLVAFIAWLEMHMADEEYDYEDCENCAVCQFLTAHGYNGGSDYDLFLDIDARIRIVGTKPWTFGAALKRARAELARR